MSSISWPLIIGIIAGLLIVGGLVGVIVLSMLASGTKGPKRFALKTQGENAEQYFEAEASWAATAEISVPGPPERVWQQISRGGYFDRLPLVAGPSIDGHELIYRSPLAGLTERIVRNDPDSGLVAVGTGVSVPFTIASCAERWIVVPDGANAKVRWTVAFTPQWVGWFPLRWTAFAVRPFMRILLKLTIH